MRQLEAFTLGKKFGHPEMNEDSLVVMPNLGYAVIDGVTDRNGTRYGGMLSGQYASRTVKRAIEMLAEKGLPARPSKPQTKGVSRTVGEGGAVRQERQP